VKQAGNWIAIIGAIVAVAMVAAVSVWNWYIIGNSGIDLNGWIALILGVSATLAVGVGLMALIFISNRRGYDEPPGKDAGKDR
jgi:presenilin-like A22 family membrane protease